MAYQQVAKSGQRWAIESLKKEDADECFLVPTYEDDSLVERCRGQ